MSDLSGRTVFMSGGSRGIGLAIAEKLAQDGANVALLAKTDQPHPKLEGTIHTAATAAKGVTRRADPPPPPPPAGPGPGERPLR